MPDTDTTAQAAPAQIPADIALSIYMEADAGIPTTWPRHTDRDGYPWYQTPYNLEGQPVMLPGPAALPLMLRDDVTALYGPLKEA